MTRNMNQMTLITRNKADCLERIFQTIRHRRFFVENFSLSHREKHFLITLSISGSRPIERLASQLNKLYDVVELSLDYRGEDGVYVKSA